MTTLRSTNRRQAAAQRGQHITKREPLQHKLKNAKSRALYGIDADAASKLNSEERSRLAVKNTYGLSAPGVQKVPATAKVIGGVATGQAAGQLAGRALATPLRRRGVKGSKIPGHLLGGVGSALGAGVGARSATKGKERAYAAAERRLRQTTGLNNN
jgi:hypothetical protein